MSREEAQEVYRGHFEECLKHLSKSLLLRLPKGSKGLVKFREPIANFCGVSVKTVVRWLDGSTSPIGETLIKLMCYLDLVGYRVIKLEKMPKGRRIFFELVGFGILSPQEAASILGYTSTSTLYQVLLGKFGVSEGKKRRMWDAGLDRKEALEKVKVEASQRYLPAPPSKSQPTKAEPTRREAIRDETPPSRHQAIVVIMGGLLLLLEEDSFKEFLEAELADQPATASTVLRLSARLSTLSSQLITDQVKGSS
ncbi:MAG: hypothetical protein A3F35_03365 [Candidatus Woykebacteria bacterium RIFCSPHIGHO2_12_FULL_45_10]|uniref:Uncharacterized protein n=1 Tax=Candidatus Woykebacteria bacterium RIFCSPHIGHO2_12_FULL_45_10 TaxID=1802603 RepID=A0A1G1WQY4_9BACT|nr:MAG: hypothetical protein A3F35_03365 [Candidatus Woykebacteria bacterium RIFCSPHIGHO2_12_FULL_45_10]